MSLDVVGVALAVIAILLWGYKTYETTTKPSRELATELKIVAVELKHLITVVEKLIDKDEARTEEVHKISERVSILESKVFVDEQ